MKVQEGFFMFSSIVLISILSLMLLGCPSPTASGTYTVTFDSQSATTSASPTTKTVSSPATTVDALPTDPVRTGYTFGGWYTAADGGGTQFTATTTVSANLTVYAKWTATALAGFTVTFDSQSATTAASPTTKTVSSSATTVDALPTEPVRTGYTFGGWYTAADGGGTQFIATTTVSASLTVYAKWTTVVAGWTSVDTSGVTGFNDTKCSILDLAQDVDGNLYLAYGLADYTVNVAKFNGTAWSIIGTGFGLVGKTYSGTALIAVDPVDKKPVLMTEGGASTILQYPVVKKYDGTTWNELDLAGMKTLIGTKTMYGIGYSDMLIDSTGKIYLGIPTTSSNYITVLKYASSAWTDTSSAGLPSATSNNTIALAIDATNTVYLGTSLDGSVNGSASGSNVTYIYKYNGSAWTSIQGSAFGTIYAWDQAMGMSGSGKPMFIVDPDSNSNYTSDHLEVYEYASTAWTKCGSSFVRGGGYQDYGIIPYGTKGLLYYVDTSVSGTKPIKFALWDGTAWDSTSIASVTNTTSIGSGQVMAATAATTIYVLYKNSPIVGATTLVMKKL